MVFVLMNVLGEPYMRFLNRRGVHTTYWVLNTDEEISNVAKHSCVSSIMTDRPSDAIKIVA
jgi:hypothetical protein